MLFALILAAASPAQAIPAAAPTTQAATTQTPAQAAPIRPNVTWAQGLLKVEASNSSLNSILREVALRTGMKIEGGVQDERVFGIYGPAPAATVLQQLLIGTKCNMMLQVDAATLPIKLTLTPLTGGVSPPNPMHTQPDQQERGFEDRLREDQQAPQPQQQNTPPPPDQPAPQPVAAPEPTSTQPTSTDSTEQSPNGVKTPQQILEQLQQLRSQQQPK